MSTVLYRKYRASDFDELVGQQHITKILKNAVKSDQLSHAYLFVGSRGTGKTSTARILAKAVNCKKLKKDGNPCGKCVVCTSISNGNFLDLIEVDAASNRGIDQIRELKERIEFSPSEGSYKVYIIDEVHMLTNEAFNALLKTLEEPPSHVIFILATTDVHKLPATILSRCQRYDFRLGSNEEIRTTLTDIAKQEDLSLEDGALDILVRNAKGSYRDALSLLDVVVNGQTKKGSTKVITEAECREVLGIPEVYMVNDLLSAFVESDSKKALTVVQELEAKGVNLQQFTNFVLEILREVLVCKISGEELPGEYTFAKDLNSKQISSYINIFLGVERDLKNTTNQILVLEMLIPLLCTEEVKTDVVTNTPKKEKRVKDILPFKKEKQSNEKAGETIVEKESEKVEVVCSDVTELNLEEIRKNWNKIAEDIKPIHSHLYAFLGSSRPLSVNGDTLDIEVPFKFHKDQIDNPVSKQIICTAIQNVLGVSSCRVKCTVNENVKPRMQASADVVLKNIPAKEKKSEKKVEDEQKSYKKKKISADVEAIFEGM